MLYWAFALLIAAGVSAALTLGGLASGFADTAKVFFLVYLALFCVATLARIINARRGDD